MRQKIKLSTKYIPSEKNAPITIINNVSFNFIAILSVVVSN